MVVRARPPLGLLSVRLRGHLEKEKEKGGSNESENEYISMEGRFASRPLLDFPIRAISAGRGGGYPSSTTVRLKYSKVLSEFNVKPRARKPLAAANTNANAKKTKAPNRAGVVSKSRNKGEGEPPTYLL